MALLNIGKKKGDEKAPPAQVPDELPPLPGEPQTVKLAEQPKGSSPQESQAPDELPPLEETEPPKKIIETPKIMDAVPKQLSIKQPILPVATNLYFSDLAKKITDAENIDEIHALLNGQIVSKVKQKYEQDKQESKLQLVQGQIQQILEPLKQLEATWRVLNDDILDKSHRKEVIEQEMDVKSKELSTLLEQVSHLKNHQ